MLLKTSSRPDSSENAFSLELCPGERCSAFVCPGYGERDEIRYFFHEAVPWPGHGNVALVQYVQAGTGAIPAFLKVTVSKGRARCQDVRPPEPSKHLAEDEELLWAVYMLHRDGHLDYRAGGYKKGRTDACHACRPDAVLQCSWELRRAGFAPEGCALSTPTP